RLIFAHKIAEGLEHSIVDWVIGSSRRATIIDSIDSIRLKAGNLTGGQHSREQESSFDDASPHCVPREWPRLDIRGDASATIEDPARGGAKRRCTGTARRHRFVRRRLAWLNRLLAFIFVVAHVIVIKRPARVVALQRTAVG